MNLTLHTNKGDINLVLFPDHAPKTVESFTGLATGEREYQDDAGRTNPTPFYDGHVFHRVISGFMIQGGCPLGQGIGGPGYQFDDEINPELNFNDSYVLAMANAGVIAGRGTNGSQFFITTAPTPWLQGKHTIFGVVADDASKRVVDALGVAPTDGRDRPLDDIVIEKVTVTEL